MICPLCVSQVRCDLQSGVRSQVTLDVVSLAELRRLGVPHTDDSLKYKYGLERDRYGTSHPDRSHTRPGQTCKATCCPPSVPSVPCHSSGSVRR